MAAEAKFDLPNRALDADDANARAGFASTAAAFFGGHPEPNPDDGVHV